MHITFGKLSVMERFNEIRMTFLHIIWVKEAKHSMLKSSKTKQVEL